jgi:hypothetical protein
VFLNLNVYLVCYIASLPCCYCSLRVLLVCACCQFAQWLFWPSKISLGSVFNLPFAIIAVAGISFFNFSCFSLCCIHFVLFSSLPCGLSAPSYEIGSQGLSHWRFVPSTRITLEILENFLDFVKDRDTVPWPWFCWWESSSMLRFLGFNALRRVTALNVICLRPVLHSVPLRKKNNCGCPWPCHD